MDKTHELILDIQQFSQKILRETPGGPTGPEFPGAPLGPKSEKFQQFINKYVLKKVFAWWPGWS